MADVVAGEELYSRYSTVTEEDGGWLTLRDIVLARKMPRRMLVQPLTVKTGEYVNNYVTEKAHDLRLILGRMCSH